MKKNISLTEEQLQNVLVKAAKKILSEMATKNNKKDVTENVEKKKITLTESQLCDVVMKVVNRMSTEGHN